MDFRYAILLLILSQVSFADCVGYTDEFDVRVLDAELRPIEGADVWITFDRGTLFGEQYFTTEPKKTGPDGKAHFKVLNQGTLARPIDCAITINGAAGGAVKSFDITANAHGPIVDVILSDVYEVVFYVRDQLNAPIANASVTIGDQVGKTNEKGFVRHLFRSATYDYLASYQEAKQAGQLQVSDDVEFIVIFTYYSISLDVIDDTGTPLPVTLTMLNETLELPDGHYEYEKTYGDILPYEVTYEGIVKTGKIVASASPHAQIVIDLNAPLFGSIEPETIQRRTKLNIQISDPGEFASGVDVQTLKASYRVEPADATTPWNSAVVFTTGFNSFAAEFPELPSDSIVQFRIEVKDKEGNKATVDGKFSTWTGPIDDTQNQTDTQENGEEEQGIPLFYIIGGVFVVILAIYLVFHIKSKA